MGKANKATKKFVASGQLKKTIQERRKKQQIQKKFAKRRGNKGGAGSAKEAREDDGDEDEEDEEEVRGKAGKSKKKMTVDSFLAGDFMDESDEDGDGAEDGEDSDLDVISGDEDDEEADMDDEEDFDDDQSFASIDDLEDDGKDHLLELSKLAEKDPEFYKYLQENDKELLEFNPDALDNVGSSDDEGDEDVDMEAEEEEKTPNLTKNHLKQWQKSLLQHRSLRALRKLLIAFRSAVHMNEDGQVLAWTIDSASVYSKLIETTLRYTPVVLAHHVPYKTLPNGKFKAPTQTPKFKALQKLILSHFYNVTNLLGQLTDENTLRLALTESAKLLPYVYGSRKCVKGYIKKCLDLWSSAADPIRVVAFLSIRKLAASGDESIIDGILKSTYLTLLRCSKSTSPYTLPSINLMKNSASEAFCLDHATAYQHAFGYIRQLAIHLRNSMKIKTKEAYKQVYNWQFAHSVDFWSIVLARACDVEAEAANGKQSELRPLIYPLVQVCLGAIKLVPNSRSHPFHLQILRSLLHLTKHTNTYVPLSSYLLPIVLTHLNPSSRPKSSTLKPLDLEVNIRVPQQYVKTKVLSEVVTEEAVYILAEWLASAPVHGSVAFPEMIVPVTVMLRKGLKSSSSSGKGKGGGGGGKEAALVKLVLERTEESAKWVEAKRRNVEFAPSKLGSVVQWERDVRGQLGDTPLAKYLKVLRKTREKRKSLVEKARQGKDEILEED
ncbi:Noc2-domain-containing protein [Agrocybe pediades]|nr:Noc2-domain-containing protein [Agrocybe pediades]